MHLNLFTCVQASVCMCIRKCVHVYNTECLHVHKQVYVHLGCVHKWFILTCLLVLKDECV